MVTVQYLCILFPPPFLTNPTSFSPLFNQNKHHFWLTEPHYIIIIRIVFVLLGKYVCMYNIYVNT